MIKMSEPLI